MTFWPSRSVALPSAPPSAVPVGDVTVRLARMQEAIDRLGTRIEAIEQRESQQGTAEMSEVRIQNSDVR